MCQGFNGKNSGDSGQNALKSYKDFANQAVSSPLDLGLSIKRLRHRENRLETIMNGGDDPGPPGF
tara:strand:+ start:333 stop:527 length:195 start_codon:yes stop_codon:yes gene_type:complete